MKEWGPKSSVCPLKPRESNFFGGISRDFAGISRKRPKSLRKNVWVQFSSPIFRDVKGQKSFFLSDLALRGKGGRVMVLAGRRGLVRIHLSSQLS